MSAGDRDTYDRSHRAYGTAGSREGFYSEDAAERERVARERAARVEEARRRAREAPPPPPRPEDRRRAEEARADELCNPAFARNTITVPPGEAKRVHLVLVDNSGSNEAIATHYRRSTGYKLAAFGAIDPEGALAMRYFSDHCDGDGMVQDVDYITPAEPNAERVLYSGTRNVHGVSGDDEAEAHECVLWDICDLDFGSVPKESRHLYLVTDVVGHGMGMRSDSGCPMNRRWQDSVEKVNKTFGTFQIVGCHDNRAMGTLQRKFLAEDRHPWDLIDLSEIRSTEHRLAISLNSLLFLMARNRGEQVVRVFLMGLYEKWLKEPIFGQDTDLRAREAIKRFMKFLEISDEAKREMEERLFAL